MVLTHYLTGIALAKEKDRKEVAKSIAKCVEQGFFSGYIFKLFFIHCLPIVNTALIGYVMCTFLDITFSHNAMTAVVELTKEVYDTPIELRHDHLLVLFPRRTVYEQWIHGPSGTFVNRGSVCVNSTASILEISYLVLLATVLVVLVLMIADKFFASIVLICNFVYKQSNGGVNHSNLQFGQCVFMLLLQKNIDPLLMDEIWNVIDMNADDSQSTKKDQNTGKINAIV